MGLRDRGLKQLIRKHGIKPVAKELLNSPAMDHLTAVLAQAEVEQLRAARALDEATGADVIQRVPSVEDRQAALKGLLEALVTESFDDVWMEEIAPELLENPERAGQYLDMDADEWEAQQARWASTYREHGAEGTDEQLAAHHVRETFGVELNVFEERVVEWNQGAEAELLFADNFRAVNESMREAAAAVAEGEE